MIAPGTYMVIVSCPAAGTQPTAGNWSGPRAQRNNGILPAIVCTGAGDYQFFGQCMIYLIKNLHC